MDFSSFINGIEISSNMYLENESKNTIILIIASIPSNHSFPRVTRTTLINLIEKVDILL